MFHSQILITCYPITKQSHANDHLVFVDKAMHAPSTTIVEISVEVPVHSNIGENIHFRQLPTYKSNGIFVRHDYFMYNIVTLNRKKLTELYAQSKKKIVNFGKGKFNSEFLLYSRCFFVIQNLNIFFIQKKNRIELLLNSFLIFNTNQVVLFT